MIREINNDLILVIVNLRAGNFPNPCQIIEDSGGAIIFGWHGKTAIQIGITPQHFRTCLNARQSLWVHLMKRVRLLTFETATLTVFQAKAFFIILRVASLYQVMHICVHRQCSISFLYGISYNDFSDLDCGLEIGVTSMTLFVKYKWPISINFLLNRSFNLQKCLPTDELWVIYGKNEPQSYRRSVTVVTNDDHSQMTNTRMSCILIPY